MRRHVATSSHNLPCHFFFDQRSSVGNAAARTETGSGYQTGFSLASGLNYGWIAARHFATGGTA